jgi:N6-adenosine-specific RNA methylase IME4
MSALNLKVHPAAKLMPLLKGDELDELVEDIRKNGQRHPVVMFQNMVLDGRNRLEACRRLKLEPKTVEWVAKGMSPTAYVVSTNIARRHLTPSQKAAIAAELEPLFAAEAKKRQRDAGGDKRSETAKRRKAEAEPKGKAAKRPAAADAAKVTGASTRSVERAAAVKKADPKLFEKVKDGELTVKQAERSIRTEKQVAQAESYKLPDGRYAVIAADPPWQYDDKLEGINRELPYPTMPLAEICALDVGARAAQSCVLWLWVTNAHLLDGSAAAVLKAWGFEAKTILTWVKDKIGLGRWLRGKTEHVILAVKGHPVLRLTNQSTVLEAPRRANSEKPPEFYAMVEELCVAPQGGRLELFARAARAGWVTSGSEAPETITGDELRTKLEKKRGAQVKPTASPANVPGAGYVDPAGRGGTSDSDGTAPGVVLPPAASGSDLDAMTARAAPKVAAVIAAIDGQPKLDDGGAALREKARDFAAATSPLEQLLQTPRYCDERTRTGTCRCTSSTPCYAKQFAESPRGLKLVKPGSSGAGITTDVTPARDRLTEAVDAQNLAELARTHPELMPAALAKNVTPAPAVTPPERQSARDDAEPKPDPESLKDPAGDDFPF